MQRAIFLLFLLLTLSHAGRALEPDGNEVALRVTGLVQSGNSGDRKSFEISMQVLKQLPGVTVHATTPYTGAAEFTGPLVRDILALAGIQAGAREVVAKGMDGYRIAIPLTDFSRYEVIAAYRQNGKDLLLETKGPLWLMYPIDKYPKELKSATTDNRLVWSLVELRIQ